jgi:2-octaprenyl-6-methoxyphenol hydroxylase
MADNELISAEVAVVGGGPAGLTAAIALAGAGVKTVLVAGKSRPADNRTTALLGDSVTGLDVLDVWRRCREQSAPLRALRIVDDTGRLWRAPEARFEACEIGREAFGWNIENRHLVAALGARAAELPALQIVARDAEAVELGETGGKIALAGGGAVGARLVVGADGRRSLCRAAAGIETEGKRYPQTALTFNLRHSRPHNDISTEFHTAQGPFTLVPLPGMRSSLVCVVSPEEAERLQALAPAARDREIERRAHSILGRVALEPGHGAFPLGIETARRFGQRRVALVGEAAHTIPPIGAQGLNLGLRDAATIAEIAVEAHRAGEDVGDAAVTDRYERARRADVTGRAVAVDLLNRTLLSDFLPFQGARGLGLYLLEMVGPLRRAVMREGVVPAASQPRLMRGEAL